MGKSILCLVAFLWLAFLPSLCAQVRPTRELSDRLASPTSAKILPPCWSYAPRNPESRAFARIRNNPNSDPNLCSCASSADVTIKFPGDRLNPHDGLVLNERRRCARPYRGRQRAAGLCGLVNGTFHQSYRPGVQ